MAPLPRGLCALLILWLVLSRPSAASRVELSNSPARSGTEQFSYVGKSAERLRREGDYLALEKLYRQALTEARRAGNTRAQIDFGWGLGNTYVLLYRYADAIDTYQQARESAIRIGDWFAVGAIAPGLSSIYYSVGDLLTARQAIQDGLDAVRRLGTHPYYEAQMKLQSARLNPGTASTISDTWDAIDAARLQNNVGLEAQAWDFLGEEYSRMNRLDAAEAALDEAYHLRLLHVPRDLRLSYLRLSALQLAQNRLPEAESFTDKAIAANAVAGASLSDGVLLHRRGLIRAAQGREDLSLKDFESATKAAESWRAVVPSQPSARTAADVQLDRQIFHSFIKTAARRALDHADLALAGKAFLATERNRAYSLQPLPSISTGIRKSPDKLESFPAGKTLIDFQQGLRDSELVLSFYAEADESYLWTVTRGSLHLYRLPSADQIGKAVERFQTALLKHEATAPQLGAQLYSTLFGQLNPRETAQQSWILSLDGPLFDLPFAALRTASDDSGRYLIESHSLQTTPSTAFLRRAPVMGTKAPTNEFLGVGDAIYNSADDRIPRAKNAGTPGQLNRLVASGEEVSRSSETWPGQVKLLRGTAATRSGFLESLRANPLTIHLATHIVAERNQVHTFESQVDSEDESRASIAFSLGQAGHPELLSTPEVAALKVNGALVVMTGCSSGTGESRPGAGLLGLTRAWLTAGADAVLATGWPVEDTRGDLLPVFYRELTSTSVAEALRRGQIAMIHSGTWQSDPAYWAAFQLTGGAR